MEEAEQIYKELMSEDVGVWFIADNFGSKVMVKAPSNAIRSLLKGCELNLVFGKDEQDKETYFHSGVKVFDDAIHFLLITGPHRFFREHSAVRTIMMKQEVVVEFYNELVVCVASSTLTLGKNDRVAALAFLGDIDKIYCGVFDAKMSKSLDAFNYSFDKSYATVNTLEIKTLSFQCHLSNWKIVDAIFVGLNESNAIKISELNEGEILEKQIWASMESLFELNLFKKPDVLETKGKRELTDLFAFHEHGFFLIESKAMAVLSITKDQAIEKRVSNVQKQIQKGISQLVGAIKNIRKGSQIFSHQGNSEINFDRNVIPHCIVLVSELLHFGDWKNVEFAILEAMVKERICLHVMDFQEFMKYIKAAKGRKEYFNYYLMTRIEQFMKKRSIHVRTVFSDEKNPIMTLS